MKEKKDWTFITNHGLVLLFVSRNPQCTTREMASTIKVTERTIHRTLIDLEKEGYITRQRTGKGNIYEINTGHGLKHELTRDFAVGDLLNLLIHKKKQKRRRLSLAERQEDVLE
jgi:DNA-binding transcriptional regulator YhcF (GntR family)